MQRLTRILLVVIVLTLSFANTALANDGEPAGSCPPAFELHPIMDHEGDPMHVHIGADVDFNADGYLCMMHPTPDLHLHVDNSLP